MSASPKVVVLGGGFAGLETAYMLRRKLRGAVEITLISDSDSFLFKPNTIYIPFGADEASLRIDLHRPLHRRHINFQPGRVEGIDPERHHVLLEHGSKIGYDMAVVGTGATMRPDEIPGLAEHASTIWTPDEMRKLGARVQSLRERAFKGEHLDVVFLVPPNNKCAGPLYEIVFMLETWLRRQHIRDRVNIVYSTYEPSFIHAFGPRLHQVVIDEFAARGVEGYSREIASEVRAGEVIYDDATTRHYDELISFPPYVSAVDYKGLPADDRGFLNCDLSSRQVDGVDGVYAPGDAGDFPVKQAFLAFLQADATAEHIASTIAGREFTQGFDPVSMCVMEMFDKATFAQVPLQTTGNPTDPVEVRPGADDAYKVGVSPLWRLGKKVLGIYLPLRFKAGSPFHAGAAWKGMEVGLKGMARVLAD